MPVAPSIAGWYGKLPTLGDFASRRWSAALVQAWDDWLAEGLGQLRASAGEAWLEPYLSSPAWRFLLMPGALPATTGALAGVLMPSVDRVGRYFPLTLAAPLPQPPRSGAALDALLAWLHELDDLAADALHDDWDIERLETGLAAMPLPARLLEPVAPPAPWLTKLLGGGDGEIVSVPAARGEFGETAVQALCEAALDGAAGLGFWLAGSQDPPRLMTCRGLPLGAQFQALFGAAESPA